MTLYKPQNKSWQKIERSYNESPISLSRYLYTHTHTHFSVLKYDPRTVCYFIHMHICILHLRIVFLSGNRWSLHWVQLPGKVSLIPFSPNRINYFSVLFLCLVFIATSASVQFSHWVVSNSLWPHGLQHARLPCPSPTPKAYSNSHPSSQWCHPTISSSVIPFSSHLQSFPASGSFPMSQLVTSGGQNIGASALASVLPMNIQEWFPLGLTGWISLQSKGSQESSPTPQFKSISYLAQAFFILLLSHPYMTTRKTIALTRWTFVGKVMSLLFNIPSRLVIAFLPRSNRPLISWLQSP